MNNTAAPARPVARGDKSPGDQKNPSVPANAGGNASSNGSPSTHEPLKLDEQALESARQSLDEGAVTPGFGPWRDDIIALLDGALATELTCVLRYRRHYFTARGMASPRIAEEFLEHSNEELDHADRIAERIVQLGGEPDFDPDTLAGRSHAEYDAQLDLTAMVRANLVAERVAIESYRQMIQLIGDKDPTTRRMLEDILGVEEEHADELSDLLDE